DDAGVGDRPRRSVRAVARIQRFDRRRALPCRARGRAVPVRTGRPRAALVLLERGDAVEVPGAIVIDDTVDESAIDDRFGTERMMVPDDAVGVLAALEGADAVVDAQLLRGVDGDGGERLVVAQPAVADRLGGFVVEAARLLGIVGVDRNEDAL